MAKSKREIERGKSRSDIAGRFKAIRTHYGCTPDQMAGFMGISRVTYEANERGRHVPTIFSLMALHDRLGISIEWVLLGKEPMSWKEEQERLMQAEETKAAEERARKEQEEREKSEETLRKKWQETLAGNDVFAREVEEMVETMKRVPLLRHQVMGFYQESRIKYKELIAESLQPPEINQPPDDTEPPPPQE